MSWAAEIDTMLSVTSTPSAAEIFSTRVASFGVGIPELDEVPSNNIKKSARIEKMLSLPPKEPVSLVISAEL